MIRLHVPQPLSAGAAILPTLDQSRYLTQVMRLKAGDALLVFNGVDGEWRCVVAEVLKKGVVLKAEERVRAQTTVPDVHLPSWGRRGSGWCRRGERRATGGGWTGWRPSRWRAPSRRGGSTCRRSTCR